MSKCEFDPENPQSQLKCIRSKSIRALMASGLSPQAIVQILCADGSDDARLQECPGFYDLYEKGKDSEYAAKAIPELKVPKQRTMWDW